MFRNITRFEVCIRDRSSIDSFQYLSSLIDFSHLVTLKLDIISNIRTSLRDSERQLLYLPRSEDNNNERSVIIEKVCSIIPQHVIQLDVTVKNIHEMITFLTRLTHLQTIIVRFPIHFLDRPQEIIAWLNNRNTDFTYHYEYSFLSIWLGNAITHRQQLTTMPSHKHARIRHRYNDF